MSGEPGKDRDAVEGRTASGPGESPAERKRREARRRILKGGAAALPVIFTVRHANAAVTWTQCADILEGQNPNIHWSLAINFARNVWGSFAVGPPSCTVDSMSEATEDFNFEEN